jgi:hypothetical protein
VSAVTVALSTAPLPPPTENRDRKNVNR